jgi:hypothetical protein
MHLKSQKCLWWITLTVNRRKIKKILVILVRQLFYTEVIAYTKWEATFGLRSRIITSI